MTNLSPFSFKIHLSYYGSCSKRHPQKCITEEGEPLTEVVVTTGANEEKKDLGGLRPYSSYSLTVSVFNNKGEGPESEARPFFMPEGGERNRGLKKNRGFRNPVHLCFSGYKHTQFNTGGNDQAFPKGNDQYWDDTERKTD